MRAQVFTVREFRIILKDNGYTLQRKRGDHEIWVNDEGKHISIPNNSKCINVMVARRLIKENNLKV